MGETNKIDWEPAARRSRGEKKFLLGKFYFLLEWRGLKTKVDVEGPQGSGRRGALDFD